MNNKVCLSVCFGVLLFSSCNTTTHHFLGHSPAIPQFEKAGEIQTQVSISTRQAGFQSAFALTPFLGASYSVYGSGQTNMTQTYTLHTFLNVLPKHNFYLSASGGYSKGQHHEHRRNNFALDLSGSYYEHWRNSSGFESWNGNLGFYFKPDDSRHLVGFHCTYHQYRFFEMTSENWGRKSGSEWYHITRINRSYLYEILSPGMSLTLNSKRGYFYFRQTTSIDLPHVRSFAATKQWHYHSQGYSNPHPDTISPVHPKFYLSFAFGVRLNVYQEVKKIFSDR